MNHTVGKVLDQFDVDHDLFHRWEGGRAHMLERERGVGRAGDGCGYWRPRCATASPRTCARITR